MSDPELLYQIRDASAWITINRERRGNAISLEVIDLFSNYLDSAEADDKIKVICLTAVGDKSFCSGADLVSTMGAEDSMAGARKYALLLKRMARFPKPFVARVNGNCLAGGMGLMLSCDLVYAHEGSKFGTPEVNVGLFPMMIGALIFRNAARKKALEMIYTARMLSAAEAEQMGLITRAVPKDDLDRVVNEALSNIAAKAPLAIKMGRQSLDAVQDRTLDDALDYLCQRLGDVASTEDAKEGMMAFFEKRQPQWKGR
ncbi:MAG: enoyl-CoA hydratase-related protein [Desulfomonilaceae bacterium]